MEEQKEEKRDARIEEKKEGMMRWGREGAIRSKKMLYIYLYSVLPNDNIF